MTHVSMLKEHNFKATPQRLCVLEILEKCGHATLDDIEKLTKEKFPTLSLSTIYRNINEMVKNNIVSEIKLSNKKEHFEILKDKHAHLVCKVCGTIEDFKIPTDALIEKVEYLSGAKVIKDTLSFEIICKDCL